MKKLTVILICVFVLAALGGCRTEAAMSDEEFIKLCESGTLQEVEAAIRAGADVNAEDGLPLMSAVNKNNNPDVLNALIKAGADVNVRPGWSPLMIAARFIDNHEILSILIQAGADINAKCTLRGYIDWTPLMLAVLNSAEVVNAFIQAGVDVNAKDAEGITALMHAARLSNDPDVSRTLIQGGSDLNAKDDLGETALMHAATNKDLEILGVFIQAGADVNARDNNGNTALMIAAISINSNPEVFSALIQAGADVNAKNIYGVTPLMQVALFNRNPDILNVLIKAGADMGASDNDGRTALDNAINNPEFVSILEAAVSANIACAAEEIRVGDIIPFGAHDWRVLEIQNGKVLLLSDRVIENRAYNGPGGAVTWETCTLRQYLNGEFYDSFNEADKARIAETRLANDNNQWFGTSGGNETSDRIFLLSLEEVVKYFGDSGDLKSRKGWYWENGPVLKDGQGYFINDQYNSARIARAANDEASGWWLRSPGLDSFDAVTVFYSGYVYVSGHYDGIHRSNGGVRPALWLNL